MAFQPKVVDLDGLRVVLIKKKGESITIRAMVGTGAREESDVDSGTAHFLEHFILNGTKKLPFDLKSYVDKFGAYLDAYTGQEIVGFTIKMHKEKVKTAIEFIGQCVSEPLLPKKLLKKEIGIIQQEIKYYEDDPMSKAHSEMEKLVFKGSNLSRDIAGTIDTVSVMIREKLEKYMDKYFVASNMIVGVVGEYDDEEVVLSLIKKEFKSIFKKKSEIIKDVYTVPEQSEAQISLVSREIEQANLFIGFRSFGRGHKDYFARSLMDIVFGRSLFSRLFLEIREKRGWAYVIGSGADSYRDVGSHYLEAGLPNNRLKDATGLILEIAYGLGGSNKWRVTDEELEIAKECFKGRLAMRFDSPERVLESAMDDLLYEGKIKTPDVILKDVEGVSLNTVCRIANETFKKEKLNLAVVGNYKKLPMKL